MDMRKLFNELVENEELQDIPVLHLMMVVTAVFELINSGRFYLDNGQECL